MAPGRVVHFLSWYSSTGVASSAGGRTLTPVSRLFRASAVLLDLDGVLYVEDEPVPGAREAVAALRDARARAAVRDQHDVAARGGEILERLERLGFEVAPGAS